MGIGVYSGLLCSWFVSLGFLGVGGVFGLGLADGGVGFLGLGFAERGGEVVGRIFLISAHWGCYYYRIN